MLGQDETRWHKMGQEWTRIDSSGSSLKAAGHTADPTTGVRSSASVVEATGNTGGTDEQAREKRTTTWAKYGKVPILAKCYFLFLISWV